MKRLIALTISLMLLLCACGTASTEPASSTAEEPTLPPVTEVTMTAQEVCAALKAQLGDSYGCSVAEPEEKALGYFGLDPQKIDSAASECNAVSSVNMDQIVVLKVHDDYVETAASLLQKGFDQKAGYAQLYEMDLFRINEARLFIHGNYVALLILGQRPDEDASADEQAAFAASEALKVDEAWEAVFGAASENIIVIPEAQQGGGMQPGGARPRG